MTILKEAVEAVLARRAEYDEAQAYYDGDVPETFATARLRKAFKTTGDRSRLNYCRPVVDAVNDRLEIGTISGDTPTATKTIQKIWKNNDLGIEAQEIHRAALVNGDAYVVVWPNANGDVDIALNSPRNMAIVYDVESPRKKLYAVKVWLADETTTRMNIYGPDKITKWTTNSDMITEGTNWSHVETVENPYGEVPVFHFRTHRPFGRPEHKDAYDGQNAINKLFITHMYTVDYQGAPQRYALAHPGTDGGSEVDDFSEGDTNRENVSALKNGPGEVWFMSGVSKMGQFDPADPAVFWTPIKDTIRSIASLTSTPVHYFEKTGNIPSGNALRTAEAPLLKKVADREAAFGYAWRDVFRFALRIEGVSSDVIVYWKAIESLDELERWDVTLKKINAGLSHRQALREGGYPEDQIEQILAEREQEAASGLFYQRAPQTRVNPSADETTPKDITDGNAA
jgi:hypothetical protein